jgi:hypothetical protein
VGRGPGREGGGAVTETFPTSYSSAICIQISPFPGVALSHSLATPPNSPALSNTN